MTAAIRHRSPPARRREATRRHSWWACSLPRRNTCRPRRVRTRSAIANRENSRAQARIAGIRAWATPRSPWASRHPAAQQQRSPYAVAIWWARRGRWLTRIPDAPEALVVTSAAHGEPHATRSARAVRHPSEMAMPTIAAPVHAGELVPRAVQRDLDTTLHPDQKAEAPRLESDEPPLIGNAPISGQAHAGWRHRL